MSSWLTFVRNTARQVIDPVWHRVWAQIEDRVAPIEARLSEFSGLRGGMSDRGDDDARFWDQLARHCLNAVRVRTQQFSEPTRPGAIPILQ